MKRILNGTIVLLLAVAIVSAALTYWYAGTETREIRAEVIALADQDLAEVMMVAETTGNAQIDDAVHEVIKDCGNRAEYERLLSDLQNLSRADLLRVADLHGNCGDYFPTVRSFMAHRLEVALNRLEAHTRLADSFGANVDGYQVDGWRSLVAKETARADLLQRQNAIQGQIIEALVDGRDADIPDLLNEAQNINGSLNVTSIQINTEREALMAS